ncbi:hypothetical protein ACJMK2_015601 [Sinanodonta woodiana]|uniref:Uncharacterized protein n=1 Tax=Sinanodonta woodiana TaxID=1069815 RepID=A0ABD3USD3_SINWO
MNTIFLQKLIQERYKSRFLGLFQSATRPHVLGSRCCYSNNLTSRPVVKTMQSTLKEKLKNAIIQAKLGGIDDRGIFICGRRRNRKKRNKKNGQNRRRVKQTVERTSSKCNNPEEVTTVGDSKCINTKESFTNVDSSSCDKFEDDVAKDTSDKESLPDSGIGTEEDEDAVLRDYQQALSLESLNINLSNNTEDEDDDEDEDPDDEDTEQDDNTENSQSQDFRDNVAVPYILNGQEVYIDQENLEHTGIELDDEEDQKEVVECLTECIQNNEVMINVKECATGRNDAEDLIENDHVSLEEFEDDEDVVIFDRNENMKGVGKFHSTSFSYKDLLHKEQVSEAEEEEDTSNSGYQSSMAPITKAPKTLRVKTLPPAQKLDESSPINDTSKDKFVCCLIL